MSGPAKGNGCHPGLYARDPSYIYAGAHGWVDPGDTRLGSIGGGADEIMLSIICKHMGILPAEQVASLDRWRPVGPLSRLS